MRPVKHRTAMFAHEPCTSEASPAPITGRVLPGIAWSDLVDDRTLFPASPTPSPRSCASEPPRLPTPRGKLSDFVIGTLKGAPGSIGPTPSVDCVADELIDDDFELALYLCYEVHYRALVHPGWEWDPGLLGYRAELERRFVRRLQDEIGGQRVPTSLRMGDVLENLIDGCSGPSLSSYLCESGTVDEFREFCAHRSAYQLKEADPHTFGIPRVAGAAKAAMVEIQYDEYGSGDATRMHSHLFGTTMSALGLDPTYGAYVDHLPGVTLATVNLVSLFGLHRRWRGALVGHLAIFEMTSVDPMKRYSTAMRRLGIGPEGRRFYDVHVEADARHGPLARDRMVPTLLEDEPELAGDLLFGAASVLMLEERFARHLLDSWARDRTSLTPWGMQLDMAVPHCTRSMVRDRTAPHRPGGLRDDGPVRWSEGVDEALDATG